MVYWGWLVFAVLVLFLLIRECVVIRLKWKKIAELEKDVKISGKRYCPSTLEDGIREDELDM